MSDVKVGVTETTLLIDAQAWEDIITRRCRKTMLRRVEIPDHVDPRNTSCQLTPEGILEIMMPFHFGPQRRPEGPSVFPIMQDSLGRRRLRLVDYIGSEFTVDDVKVVTRGHKLIIEASYGAEIGKYGEFVSERQIKKEYALPSLLRDIDDVNTILLPDGRLFVDVVLKKRDKRFSYQISSKVM